jgi:hypothetical protein
MGTFAKSFLYINSRIHIFSDFRGNCKKIWKTDRVSFQQAEKSLFIFTTELTKKVRYISHNQPVSFLISRGFNL